MKEIIRAVLVLTVGFVLFELFGGFISFLFLDDFTHGIYQCFKITIAIIVAIVIYLVGAIIVSYLADK